VPCFCVARAAVAFLCLSLALLFPSTCAPTAELSPLSLHDALPISRGDRGFGYDPMFVPVGHAQSFGEMEPSAKHAMSHRADAFRSEEHTSELQSRRDLVCRLLLEKKKKNPIKLRYNPQRSLQTYPY